VYVVRNFGQLTRLGTGKEGGLQETNVMLHFHKGYSDDKTIDEEHLDHTDCVLISGRKRDMPLGRGDGATRLGITRKGLAAWSGP